MIPVEALFAFITASALLAIVPGPDNIFVLLQSTLYGKKAGILITAGLCTGLLFHTLLVVLGVAVIFQTSTLAFNLLTILGAIYLLYLAWLSFKASSSELKQSSPALHSSFALYRRGIIMNITNPKVSLFFLAFLPQFTSPENGQLHIQILILGGLFILVAFIIFNLIAIGAGQLVSWLEQSPKVQQNLNRLAAIVFIVLAIKLALFTHA